MLPDPPEPKRCRARAAAATAVAAGMYGAVISEVDERARLRGVTERAGGAGVHGRRARARRRHVEGKDRHAREHAARRAYELPARGEAEEQHAAVRDGGPGRAKRTQYP